MQPVRAALYLRQSVGNDEGIERQRERCAQLAQLRGWTVVAEFEDNDVSASKARGPETAWGRMLATSDTFDVLIAVDLDRAMRSIQDLGTLIEANVKFATVDGEIDLSTADGEFRATMLAAIARFEVRRKGERQQRANEQRARAGKPPKGTRLTGYTIDGAIVPSEAALVRSIFNGFLSGETLKGLAADLNDRALPTRNGRPWNSSTIRTMLLNARYAGLAVYRGQSLGQAAQWEGIVSEDVFHAVQARLADPRRMTNRLGTARKYLGSGLYLCGICEQPLRTNGPRYWCPQGGHVTRSLAPIDELVRDVLAGRLSRPDAREIASSAHDDSKASELAQLARDLRARLSSIESDYDDGLIDGARYRVASEKVAASLLDVERRQAELTHGAAISQILAAHDPGVEFRRASLDRQRLMVDAFLTVKVLPAPQGRRGFDPRTVEIDWRT